MPKIKEKEIAIDLRKKGLSYREILKKVAVAKSTLSLWLRSVELSKKQEQRLTHKKLLAAFRGAKVRKNQRLDITKKIKEKARKEIKRISNKELLFIGTSLYWAEGTKQKEHNVSQDVKLGNSDPRLIRVFLKWLLRICKISKEDIYFRIFIHKDAERKLSEVKKYWSRETNFPIESFQKVSWKKHKISSNRKNKGKTYYGLLEVRVKRSTNLNRKIAGWIEGISKIAG